MKVIVSLPQQSVTLSLTLIEGYRLTSQQWGEMLEIMDKDKSGFISADEFCYTFGTEVGNLEII